VAAMGKRRGKRGGDGSETEDSQQPEEVI
jgi:hypothetical protein